MRARRARALAAPPTRRARARAAVDRVAARARIGGADPALRDCGYTRTSAGGVGANHRRTCVAAAAAAALPPPPPVEAPHPYQCTLCGFSCPTSQGLACHKRSAAHIAAVHLTRSQPTRRSTVRPPPPSLA